MKKIIMRDKDKIIRYYFIISILIFFILMLIALVLNNKPNVFVFGVFALFQMIFYEKYRNYILLKEIKKLKENND